MEKVLLDTLGNIFLLTLGLISVIFYKWCARETARFYSKLFHRDYDEKIYRVFFLLGGIIFAVLNFLSLLRIRY